MLRRRLPGPDPQVRRRNARPSREASAKSEPGAKPPGTPLIWQPPVVILFGLVAPWDSAVEGTEVLEPEPPLEPELPTFPVAPLPSENPTPGDTPLSV
jgi:hypothetical protein